MTEPAPVATEQAKLWHPFAGGTALREPPFVIARAEDVWVFDEQGNRYLDATASLWSVNVGHRRPEILEAIAHQMKELDTYHTFNDFANRPALALAARLSEYSPMTDSRLVFGSGGGDGVETAAKLAREYFKRTGRPQRNILVSRQGSYHGTHGFGTSIAGIEGNRLAAPLHPDTARITWNDPQALRALIAEVGADRIAGVFLEPVMGAGGVLPPPPGYVEEIAGICEEHGILLIVDAVICGFGRLGNWFGIERFGVTPDLIVFAKGVTSGYLPLGGVVVGDTVAAPFWDSPGAEPFRHGVTYSGHPAACAAGLANLDVIEGDGLLERADVLEQEITDALTSLADHPLVSEVRSGVGALGAIELDPERKAAEQDLVGDAFKAIRSEGTIIRPLLSAIAVSPPLTATPAHIDHMVTSIARGLDSLT